MKKTISFLICVILLLTSIVPVSALSRPAQLSEAINNHSTSVVDSYRISDNEYMLVKNVIETHHLCQSTLSNPQFDVDAIKVKKLSVGNIVQVELDLIFENNSIGTATLVGEKNTDFADEGYYCVAEGSINLNQDVTERSANVIINLVYSKDEQEMYSTLTIEPYDTDEIFIAVYGEYTESIRKINGKRLERMISENDMTNRYLVASDSQGTRIDTTISHRGSKYISKGSYSVGYLYLYHTAETSASGSSCVAAKVISNTQTATNYVINCLGVDSGDLIYTRLDRAYLSITGTANNGTLFVAPNGWDPQTNATTFTWVVPIYLGSVIGLQTFSINQTMSSTTATKTNNSVTWTQTKTYGWAPNATNGSVSSNSGVWGEILYKFSGNISSQTSGTFTATGSGRYVYVVGGNDDTNVHFGYFSTNSATISSSTPMVIYAY